MNLICKVILIYLLSISFAQAQPSFKGSDLNEIAILVPSCDKYREAWDPFFNLLFKQWPNINKVHLISGNKTFTHSQVHPIQIENEKSWSDNMLTALDKIKEPYILIVLEDYFITKKVDEHRLKEVFELMKKENAAYLALVNVSLSEKTPHPSMKTLGYLKQDADYRTALQVAIWDKQILKQILKSGESPWQFELVGTPRSRTIERPFMCLLDNFPIEYFGGIEKGYWTPKAVAYLKKENIAVSYQLPIDNAFRQWWRGPARNFLSSYFVSPVRKIFNTQKEKA